LITISSLGLPAAESKAIRRCELRSSGCYLGDQVDGGGFIEEMFALQVESGAGVDYYIIESLTGDLQQFVDGFSRDIRGRQFARAASTNNPDSCCTSRVERKFTSSRLVFWNALEMEYWALIPRLIAASPSGRLKSINSVL